jgi:hypothetical protein
VFIVELVGRVEARVWATERTCFIEVSKDWSAAKRESIEIWAIVLDLPDGPRDRRRKAILIILEQQLSKVNLIKKNPKVALLLLFSLN